MWRVISVPYVYQKRGVYYFSRRVPKDLEGYYNCRKLALSLRTKSLKAAKAKSASLASQLEEEWLTLRWRRSDSPLRRFLHDQAFEARTQSMAPLMSEAKDIYLKTKGVSRPKTFTQAIVRAVNSLIELAGDKPVDTYSRQDANLLRDAQTDRGLNNATVKKTLNTLRTIVNFTNRECGLKDVNAFSGMYFADDEHNTETKRQPIPIPTIRTVQMDCRALNDEARWLIALISDTGMRLSEAAGLIKDDICLDHKHPHIVLKVHPWRRLKTKGSERIVPLAGEALWAATQASKSTTSQFLFPRYCNDERCKSNSASAALNKWLSSRVPDGCVVHSFRHSIRDRLRAVECPQDIMDRLGGWSLGGIGESYGTGYPVEVLFKWLKRAVKV
jgi:integrase